MRVARHDVDHGTVTNPAYNQYVGLRRCFSVDVSAAACCVFAVIQSGKLMYNERIQMSLNTARTNELLAQRHSRHALRRPQAACVISGGLTRPT
jgi:hypothetical protein